MKTFKITAIKPETNTMDPELMEQTDEIIAMSGKAIEEMKTMSDEDWVKMKDLVIARFLEMSTNVAVMSENAHFQTALCNQVIRERDQILKYFMGLKLAGVEFLEPYSKKEAVKDMKKTLNEMNE